MLGSGPTETVPDGLISLSGCVREEKRACVFAITDWVYEAAEFFSFCYENYLKL